MTLKIVNSMKSFAKQKLLVVGVISNSANVDGNLMALAPIFCGGDGALVIDEGLTQLFFTH